jgi:hypothetical protein
LHGCSLYHFAKYRNAMEKKITLKINPTSLGFTYALK